MDRFVNVEENNPALNLCPKCGADALIVSWDGNHRVRCRWVACDTHTPWSVSEEDVVALWNELKG